MINKLSDAGQECLQGRKRRKLPQRNYKRKKAKKRKLTPRTTSSKTKKQRQGWWNNLTLEQQEKQVIKWQAKKAEKRLENSVKFMRKIKEDFPCEKCFHRQSKSCTDDLPRGCEYWFWPGKVTPVKAKWTDKKEWRKLIRKQNPWLKVA